MDVGEHPLANVLADFVLRAELYKLHTRHTHRLSVTASGFTGTLNSDGLLFGHSDTANVFRWLVVTDIGLKVRLDAVDATNATEFILDFVREYYADGHTPSEAASFLEELKGHYRRGQESRFGDGYLAVANTLWRSASQDLYGEARDFPYTFCY